MQLRRSGAAAAWIFERGAAGWKAVVEFSGERHKRALDFGPPPPGILKSLKRIKNLF